MFAKLVFRVEKTGGELAQSRGLTARYEKREEAGVNGVTTWQRGRMVDGR